MKYLERLIEFVKSNLNMLVELQLVRSLNLPDAYIAAGYVRNQLWDYLHGYKERTPLSDVDVIYFDPTDINESTEKIYEQRLISQLNIYKWSVKNQARMHIHKNDPPYSSIEDAMMRWPETATAIAIRLNAKNEIEVVAPYGLEDLFEMRIRRSPYFHDQEYYLKRIAEKKWLTIWPRVQLVR